MLQALAGRQGEGNVVTMIYAIVEVEYYDDAGSVKKELLGIVEGFGDPQKALEVWRDARYAAHEVWYKDNPHVQHPNRGTINSEETWDTYQKLDKAYKARAASEAAFKAKRDADLGATRIEALVKAGFKLLKHVEVQA